MIYKMQLKNTTNHWNKNKFSLRSYNCMSHDQPRNTHVEMWMFMSWIHLVFWKMGVYLSTPNTEKNSCDETCKNFTYGASSMQGWRMTQEVKFIVDYCYCPLLEFSSLFVLLYIIYVSWILFTCIWDMQDMLYVI